MGGRSEALNPLFESQLRNEHPSSMWAAVPGVSRLHIKESYIFGDYTDTGVIRAMEHFMSHVEHASAQLCMGHGDGRVKKRFDEAIDIHFYTRKMSKQLD